MNQPSDGSSLLSIVDHNFDIEFLGKGSQISYKLVSVHSAPGHKHSSY